MDIEEENILVEFRSTGTITGGSKIKLSNGKQRTMPLLSLRDRELLKEASTSTTIDYITVPLVNSKKDIDSVRDNLGPNAKII